MMMSNELSVISQEPARGEDREVKTIIGLLREQLMEESSRSSTSRTKKRLGLRGLIFGCCRAKWGFGPTTTTTTSISIRDHEDNQHQHQINQLGLILMDPGVCLTPSPTPIDPPPPPGSSSSSSSNINLAMALAAERQFRELRSGIISTSTDHDVITTKVSLMRLLEEAAKEQLQVQVDGQGQAGDEALGNDSMCCVCMVRKKGAAFIPCGHTYCRVCSRDLWLNRGSCPLCNRSIIEILDIF